ncbi:MAG: EF-1 guanine nucleotide exchange domain-containing protein [Cyanobacteriota bacterium]|nr:EF-1 guanine nucleotide exchange domain-containing protein [Cyanobacteriota bacterium]
MALTAVECPNGTCHSHHGGHHVERQHLRENIQAHGTNWCERLAERVYEISVDSFCQSVMPTLNQDGWQRRHLNWEFKLETERDQPEKALVDGTINAIESFLRSHEVQQLFVQELVRGTLAETEASRLRQVAVGFLIEKEILALLEEQREELLERVGQSLLEEAEGDFGNALDAARAGLDDVQRLLLNHAEAMR